MTDPLSFLLSHSRGRLDVAPLEWEGFPVFLLNHPDHVAEALLLKQRDLRRSGGPRRLQHLLGEGLLRSQGEQHKKSRRLTQLAFTPKLLGRYDEAMRSLAKAHLEDFPEDQSFDLHPRLVRLALAIAAKTFFSLDLENRDVLTLGRAMSDSIRFLEAGKSRLSEKWRGYRFHRACGNAERLLYQWISERRRDPRDSDLLSALINARDEETGGALEDRQLRDELMTLFVAGHETTASALSWSVYLLALHPQWQARLAEGGEPGLARAIFAETLRLYPPAWILFRRTLADMQIGGVDIPSGSHLVASPYSMGRNPAVFPMPETFSPERWLNGNDEPLSQGAFFPFGLGNRRCLGEAFAWSEGSLLLEAIARRGRIRLTPGFRVEPFPAFTLRPKNGIRIILEPHSKKDQAGQVEQDLFPITVPAPVPGPDPALPYY